MFFFIDPACLKINTKGRCYVLDPFCQPRKPDNETNNNYEAIVSSSLGVLVAVCIIAGFLLFCYRTKQNRKRKHNVNSNKDQPEGKIHNIFTILGGIVKF